MIIDAHTHIFPPEAREKRAHYAGLDATFRAIYGDEGSPLATAEELLASMEQSGVDRSVVCGFAWSDAELCRWHSEYLLEAAASSGGRLTPFCTVHPSEKTARDDLKRYATRGARGLGELRPESQGYSLIDSEEADLLAWGADAYDMALLFHVGEPVGPPYAGKAGASVEQLGRFVMDFANVTVIAAHWGGGLPFYALMPELKEALSNTYFDTAGSARRYEAAIFRVVLELAGTDRVLFGSDFPHVAQEEALRQARGAGLAGEELGLVLGDNAAKLLRLA